MKITNFLFILGHLTVCRITVEPDVAANDYSINPFYDSTFYFENSIVNIYG